MPFIGEDQVRQIKARVDLVQLMGEYTTLRKSGANFTGCCVFHQERTPSMYVYADQQTYHCFGCGAHGDAITLVREKERLEFTEVVEFLAKRAGVTVTYQDSGRGGDQHQARGVRDEQLAAVEFATQFYERVLWESPDAQGARDYLAKRAMSEQLCRRFRLGWSQGSGRLVEEGRRQGITAKTLMAVDLAVERNGRVVDRFFERVMFPICDRFGHPIAFSGRLLPEAERRAKEEGRGVGKYINNTDTPLYHKGGIVFNLHRARTVCRDKGRLIVMEGPTDVMAADDAGFSECVAVLGTALTPEHARQLGNLIGTTGKLIVLLDGDSAGQTNALKAVRTCLATGVPMRVAILPDELDPAELLAEDKDREHGRRVMEEVLASGRADIDHLLRTLAPRPYELDNRAQVAITDQLLEALRPMPDPELRALHLRDVGEWLGIERSRLERRLASVEAKPPARTAATSEDAPSGPEVPPLSPDQELCLHVLVRCADLRAHAGDDLGLEPSHFPAPWSELAGQLLLDHAADIHVLVASDLLQRQPALQRAAFAWANTDLAARQPAVGDPRTSLAEAIQKLKRTRLTDELRRLTFAVAEAEKARDFQRAGALSREKRDVTQALKDIAGQSGI